MFAIGCGRFLERERRKHTELSQLHSAIAAPGGLLVADATQAERKETHRYRLASNPDHQADVFRSIPLKQFEVLAELPNVELYSLQSGHGVEQMSKWQGAQPLRRFGDNVDKSSGAFMDTAAIMQQLDLIITSDTSIAHLDGALGVPTWIALNYIPDWRWLLGRSDSPWYPSVRLFRQPGLGDWPGVFREIKRHLNNLKPVGYGAMRLKTVMFDRSGRLGQPRLSGRR